MAPIPIVSICKAKFVDLRPGTSRLQNKKNPKPVTNGHVRVPMVFSADESFPLVRQCSFSDEPLRLYVKLADGPGISGAGRLHQLWARSADIARGSLRFGENQI